MFQETKSSVLTKSMTMPMVKSHGTFPSNAPHFANMAPSSTRHNSAIQKMQSRYPFIHKQFQSSKGIWSHAELNASQSPLHVLIPSILNSFWQ